MFVVRITVIVEVIVALVLLLEFTLADGWDQFWIALKPFVFFSNLVFSGWRQAEQDFG